MPRKQYLLRFYAAWLTTFVFLGAIFVSIAPAAAQPANYAVVTTTLNMRSGPGTQYGVVLVLPQGANVPVYQCTAARSWCEVGYSGRVGWAAARYLNFQGAASGDPEPPAASGPVYPPGQQVTGVTTVTLNMRRGPGTNYGVILSIPAGTTVPINRCIQGYVWCEVTHRGYTGWVSASYLRSTSPQYGQQPVANIGAQLGLALFNFIIGQIGGQTPPPPVTPPPTQPRVPGPNEVCFYRDQNYGGNVTCVAMGQNDPSLGGGWNDVISSIRVGPGAIVEVCENINYGGICRVFTGNAQSLGDMNDRISSFRTTQIGAGQPPPVIGRACFYTDQYFQGQGFCLGRGDTIAGLDQNWNDRISSIQVSPGLIVQVCRDANFGGWCEEYNGDVPQLPNNRNDAISSIRVF